MSVGSKFSSLTGLSKQSRAYRVLRRTVNHGLRAKSLFGPRSSYAAGGEDLILLNLFKTRSEPGTYVDIGAGHPKHFSNTYALYREGWKGTTVDPIRRNVIAARRLRSRDTQIHALCGASDGSETLFEFDPYELSTVSPDRVAELKDAGHAPVDQYPVSMITLAGLNLRASPEETCVLSIDTEGWELPVLLGNDWSRYLPAVICIEEWSSPLLGASEVKSLLEANGYSLIAHIAPSSFYVHNESGI